METTRANSITAAQNMHSKRRPVRGAISKAKIWWKKTACLQMWVQMWRQNNAAPKCGFRHKCGGASEMMEMWLQTMWRRNVASGTNVVAVRNVASNNVASKCGVRHKCGGSPKCGVKMWRQTLPLPNCLPGNVSSKKVFSGRHKSATLNACALYMYIIYVYLPLLCLPFIDRSKEASKRRAVRC